MSSTDQPRSPRIRRKGSHPGSYCCVPGCSNHKRKDNLLGVKLSYHRFPLSNPKRTKLWINHIRREAWFPKSTDRICSIHFEGGKKSDDPKKPGYIPTVFPFRQKAINPRTTLNSSKVMSPPAKRVRHELFPDSPTSSRGSTTHRSILSPPSISSSDDDLHDPPDTDQGNLTPSPEEEIQVTAFRKDHDYANPCRDPTTYSDEVERLKQEIRFLKQENEDLKKKVCGYRTTRTLTRTSIM